MFIKNGKIFFGKLYKYKLSISLIRFDEEYSYGPYPLYDSFSYKTISNDAFSSILLEIINQNNKDNAPIILLDISRGYYNYLIDVELICNNIVNFKVEMFKKLKSAISNIKIEEKKRIWFI